MNGIKRKYIAYIMIFYNYNICDSKIFYVVEGYVKKYNQKH